MSSTWTVCQFAYPGEDEGFGDIREIHWKGDHIVFEAEPGNWRHWYSISVDDPKPEQKEQIVSRHGFLQEGQTRLAANPGTGCATLFHS